MAGLTTASTPLGLDSQEPKRGRILAVVPSDCSFEHMAVNQRLRALAEIADVDIVASYPASFPAEIKRKCQVRGFKLSARFGSSVIRLLAFSTEVAIWATVRRIRHDYQIVYTFQDTSACAGAMLRCRSTHWVMDILDDPSLELRNAEQRGRRCKAAVLRLRCNLIARMARSADLVVTIGCSDGDPLPVMIQQRYGVMAERLLPLRQAIRMDLFSSPKPRQRAASCTRSVFYVGWVSALRGIHTLIEAIDILREQGEKVELRLAGALKGDEASMRAMIEARSYINYLGILPSQAVHAEISSADICCCPFPDREELAPVQPVKLLEYLALGRPTVASATHGISSLIEHEISGLLAIPECAASFAEAIGRIVKDGQMADRLSEGARARASSFEITDVNKDLHQWLMPWLS